ncbi:E3 ubiquitin-protein ligase SIAH1A-like [Anticarsia gemmatalis]|uniref:E3 ubiquitin-protein ligase SIAH1A-like n=1 Tax=Anticarsia gemmatalis TaxID=129554 RepID=UPI003F772F69
MGNENSSPPKLTQEQVNAMLDAQRREYEEKCRQYMRQAENATATHAQIAANAATIAVETTSQGREREPPNYLRADRQQVQRESSPGLYPNLPTAAPTTYHFNSMDPRPQTQESMFVNSSRYAGGSRPSAPPHPRNRSVSRQRTNNTDDEVGCPTCHGMFGLRIYQCNQGHSSCETCREYRRPCGICGNEITSMRNFTIEGFVAEKKVPCPHADDGCTLVFKTAEMEYHAKECPFKPLTCPLGCQWRGKLRQLSAHCDNSHPASREADVGTEMRLLNISNSIQTAYLILIGTYNFLFHIKVSDGKIYMAAQLIGTAVSAAKWSYEIQVYNKSESRRKYTYTEQCSSYVEPVADVFNEGKCSIMPHSHASTFYSNGQMTFKFFIKKSFEPKELGARPKSNFRPRGRGRQ